MSPVVGWSPHDGLLAKRHLPRPLLLNPSVWPTLKPVLSKSKSSDKQMGMPSYSRPVHSPGVTLAQDGTWPCPRRN